MKKLTAVMAIVLALAVVAFTETPAPPAAADNTPGMAPMCRGMGPGMGPGMGRGMGKGMGPCMTGQCGGMGGMCAMLNLNDDQQKNIAKLQQDHRRKMIKFKSDLHSADVALKLLITDDKYDAGKVDAAIENISKLKKDMLKAKIAHQKAVRELLTTEQQVIFDQKILSGKGCGAGPQMRVEKRMRQMHPAPGPRWMQHDRDDD